MTTRTRRIEVITRGERRRRWSIVEKREIVAESLRPGIRPSEVMRKHGFSSGQLYAWRQQLTRRLGDEVPGRSANFARVDVVVAQRQEKTDPVGDTTMVAVARQVWPGMGRPPGQSAVRRTGRKLIYCALALVPRPRSFGRIPWRLSPTSAPGRLYWSLTMRDDQ